MPRYEELDWYDTPRWYDLVFDEGTEREADFLEAVHALHAGGAAGREKRVRARGAPSDATRSSARPLRVLEPACGSGRLVAELARRGHTVHGFDLNERMLDFARARLSKSKLRASLAVGDMSAFTTRARFDLAHCLVSTFKYLQDERAATNHLRCVADALVPGGVYVLGLHLTDYASRSRSRERWVARDGRARVVCNTQVEPAERSKRLEDVRTRLVVTTNGKELRSETRWRFRTYDVRELKTLLARVPAFEHVATYDFTHDATKPRALDGELLDVVLVLRRRARTRALDPRL
ncbi:MAG: class I SAM-dependent methyltransferase [Planctomycetes bacterium]|nr:class I SAM-dependent methyltransferase [Planctomycetota bacterium]